MKQRLTGYSSLALLILLLLAGANTLKCQEWDESLRFVNPDRRSVTVPFRLINNLIVLPVFINDSDSLFFILDTGITNSIMTELSTGEGLSLNYIRQIKLQGLGKGDPIDAFHSTGNTYDISGIVGENQDLFILLQNIFNLSTLLGTKIHGLLSFNEFRDFVVEINYEKRQITFHNPSKYRYRRSGKSRSLPLVLENSKPYLSAVIEQENGTIVPLKLLLDLGASHALWIELSSDERLLIPEKTIPTFLGTGLSGQIHGKIGRINKLILGDFKFEDPLTAFPDSLSAFLSFGLDQRNGSLGSEVMRRFTTIIDYPNKLLTLTPNNYYRQDFNINMSGIEIEALYPGLPVYTIAYIRKNSPGGRAGLRRGDQIVSINNKDVINMDLHEIYEIFESDPGKLIKMVVKRSGHRFKTFFYLEDWI